ncbi:MAG: cytochrome c oxidase assembly protein [Acidimicrobiales bacterium]
MSGHPWAFHLHWAALVSTLAAGLAAGAAHRWGGPSTRRQRLAVATAVVLVVVAFQWPLADLAARWSLAALVVQRLVLMVAVPGLLLVGLPAPLLRAVTRPAAVDGVVRRASRPPVAVAVVTVVAVATLTTAAVDAQAADPVVDAAVDLLLVATGAVLWLPVIGRVPGIGRPSALGRAAYLIVQSIVPSFLAVVWIFARHPLYPVYAHAPAGLGIAPVTDQQVAGFVAKLGTIVALWSVAAVIVLRDERRPAGGAGTEPLTWDDVERQLERAERAERRARRWGLYPPPAADRPGGGDPPPAGGTPAGGTDSPA